MRKALITTAAVLLLSACATTPQGPTVQAMPGPHDTFERFAADNQRCKQFAASEVGGGAHDANVGQAIIGGAGMLLGAGLGAAIGGGHGAAIGAASGAGLGVVGGGMRASSQGQTLQRQYDIAYSQCMAALRHSVPVAQAGRG